jgi:hypothetical protein
MLGVNKSSGHGSCERRFGPFLGRQLAATQTFWTRCSFTTVRMREQLRELQAKGSKGSLLSISGVLTFMGSGPLLLVYLWS